MINIERLKERLKAVGLTPNAASEAAGLGRSYLRDVLRGRIKEPSALRMTKLAEVLKCSPGYLVGEEGNAWLEGLPSADDRSPGLVKHVQGQIAQAMDAGSASYRLMFDLLDAVDERMLVDMVYLYIAQSAFLSLLATNRLSAAQLKLLCGPEDSEDETDLMKRAVACQLAGLTNEGTTHKTTLLVCLRHMMHAPGGPSSFEDAALADAVALQVKAAGIPGTPTPEIVRLTIMSLLAEYLQIPQAPRGQSTGNAS